jgi:hypothetical protein
MAGRGRGVVVKLVVAGWGSGDVWTAALLVCGFARLVADDTATRADAREY